MALLQQRRQFAQGGAGELSAKRRGRRRGQVGGLDGEAPAHEVPIGHDHLAGARRRLADRNDRKAAPVERVARVGHFDLVGLW